MLRLSSDFRPVAIKRQALFWGSLFLAIVAFVLHIHQVFTMAAALACLPLVARFLGRHKLVGLQLRRVAPQSAVAGERVRVHLDVTNTARTRRLFFIVSDRVPTTLQPHGAVELPVAILGPGEQTRLSYDLLPERRGAYPLGPLRLLAPDAIGLRQYGRDVQQIDELLVYPQALPLAYLWPTASGGRHPVRPRRRLRGQGDDLYGIRDYVPGDDPRRIDWKTTARRNKLAVVEYERPESLETMIVLDLDRHWHCGAGDQHTLEYAVTLAATLIEQAYERGSTVGLIAAGNTEYVCPSVAEGDQRLRLYEMLARVQPDGDRPLPSALSAHEALLPSRCAVAVISASPHAGPVATHLRGLGHSLAWFVLDAPTFDAHVTADYTAVQEAVAAVRAKLHVIGGDVPLAAHWGTRLGRQAFATQAAEVSHALL